MGNHNASDVSRVRSCQKRPEAGSVPIETACDVRDDFGLGGFFARALRGAVVSAVDGDVVGAAEVLVVVATEGVDLAREVFGLVLAGVDAGVEDGDASLLGDDAGGVAFGLERVAERRGDVLLVVESASDAGRADDPDLPGIRPPDEGRLANVEALVDVDRVHVGRTRLHSRRRPRTYIRVATFLKPPRTRRDAARHKTRSKRELHRAVRWTQVDRDDMRRFVISDETSFAPM